MSLSLQTQVKGYQIIDLIDTGGFGEVYRARQEAIDRDVAIKIILPQHANKPDFIRRFEAEAQLVAKLEHPHITPLYDYWRDPDGAYLVMRYLRGGNLRDLLARRGCLDLQTAAHILDQVASALFVAHRNNIIHRDIKPENILLDEDGNAYLTDFGIAKDLEGTKSYMTNPDAIMGSLDYISPEQAHSQPVDPRTDVYSLGVVMWESLVGKHPFEELSSIERLYKFINEPLPLIESLDPESNDRINAVIQKATEKNPEHRYEDVLAFADAFREAAGLSVEQVDFEVTELLTAREQDVLRCLAERKSNKQISEELVIELSTVKWYVRQIFKKLNVRSRVQAAARAKELNLVYHERPERVSTTGILALPELENPYKGLNAFTAADEQDFFGREKLVLRLMERMSEKEEYARFLAIVGPSGSGKSSLVKAGLIPALWRGGLPGSEKWFIVEMVPGTDVLDELEVALTRIVPQQGLNIGEYLRRDEKGLLTASKLILPEDDSELVLVVDQFEELFTLVEKEEERVQFLELISTAVVNKRSRVRVVVTMRADFYDRPLHYPASAEMIRNRVETILPLSAEELERAIANPAKRVGLRLEEGLLARIINDVLYQPGGLPLMQYALTELYEARENRTLSLSGYKDLGGVVGALANRAEQIYLEMDKKTRQAAQQIFLRLVTLGDDGKNTRRRTPLTELTGMFDDTDMVEEIVDTYTAYRLLSMDNDPETRQPIVEVAHEAILVEWGRLSDWLNESQMDIRIHRQLAHATRDWVNANREDSYLLRGARLQQFEGWREETDLALTATEIDFLEKSIAERERERLKEEARQARERALEERAQKILRGLVGVMAIAAVIAVGLSIYAFGQRNEALQNFSMSLAAHVQNALDENQFDTALALALAAAEITNPPAEVKRVLREAAYAPGPTNRYQINVLFGNEGYIYSVETSPVDMTALLGFDDGTIYLWDIETSEILLELRGHTQVVQDLSFSPDGKTALSASHDGIVIQWDLSTGKEIKRFIGHNGWVRAVDFSPDGKSMVSGGYTGNSDDKIVNPGELFLWNIESGEIIKKFDGHPSAVVSVDFRPDGKSILASSGLFIDVLNETDLYLWDVETSEVIFDFEVIHDNFNIAISPNGLTAISGDSNGNIHYYDLNTGLEIQQIKEAHEGMVRSVAYLPDGMNVISSALNGQIILWDISTWQKKFQSDVHTAGGQGWSRFVPMVNIAIASDGQTMLSTSEDQFLVVWKLKNELESSRLVGHKDLVWGLAFSPDGKFAVTGTGALGSWTGSPGEYNDIYIWDLQTNQLIKVLENHKDLVMMIRFSDNGERMIVGSLDGTISVWNTADWSNVMSTHAHTGGTFAVDISPDGSIAISGSMSNSLFPDDGIFVWDVDKGEMLYHFEKVSNTTTIDIASDGKTFWATGLAPEDERQNGMGLILVNLETGETIESYSAVRCCTGFAISSDQKFAYAAENYDTILKEWDLSSDKVSRLIGNPHGGTRTRVALTPDEKLIFTSGTFGNLYLWDRITGEELISFSSGGYPIDIDISHDGKMALTPGEHNSAMLWDLTLPMNIDEVQEWISENRYVRDLTCEERFRYNIEPLCEQE